MLLILTVLGVLAFSLEGLNPLQPTYLVSGTR